LNCAFVTDLLRTINLKKGLAGRADWKKQIAIEKE
jgi:hypothetical protein